MTKYKYLLMKKILIKKCSEEDLVEKNSNDLNNFEESNLKKSLLLFKGVILSDFDI